MKIIFTLLLFSIFLVNAREHTRINHEYDFDVDGHSGQIKLGTTDFNVQLSCKFLEEIDSNNTIVKHINNMATQNFIVVPLAPHELLTTNGNITVPRISIYIDQLDNHQTGIKPYLEIQYWLINSTMDVIYGNTTTSVVKEQIKFTVIIKNWHFNDNNNKLRFVIKLVQNGAKHHDIKIYNKPEDLNNKFMLFNDNDEHDHLHYHEKRISFDTSNLDISTLVVIDDKTLPVEYSIFNNNDDDDENEDDHNSYLIEWKFPSFTNSLYYDPTLSMANVQNVNNAFGLSINLYFILILFIINLIL